MVQSGDKKSRLKKASLCLGITHQDPKSKIRTNRIRSGCRLPLNHAGRLEVETKLSGYCSTLSRRRYHIARTNIGKHPVPRTNSVSNKPIVPHVTVLRLWRTSNLQNRSASADEAKALCTAVFEGFKLNLKAWLHITGPQEDLCS